MEKFIGGFLGMAIGDGLGTTVEFMSREYVSNHRVFDMIGGGKFDLNPGEFTDDTSMALCITESLIINKGEFLGNDIVEKFFDWYKLGHLSSNGKCFDIGTTTLKAILYCLKNNVSVTDKSNTSEAGNGCLMRLLPVVLCYSYNFEQMMKMTVKSVIITHNSIDAIDSCRYFASLIYTILENPQITKSELLSPNLLKEYWSKNPIESKNILLIKNGSYMNKSEDEIFGKGVVHLTLESVLWAFYNSPNFEEGVLKVINLGDDADTTGCIFGALAGCYYGLKGIPKKWKQIVALKPLIESMSKEIFSIYRMKKDYKEFSISKEFLLIYNDYMELELSYRLINRRLEPCPKSYKNVEEFDEDVKNLKNSFFKRKNASTDLFECFEIRLRSNRKMLEDKFFYDNVPPPPIIPDDFDDDVSIQKALKNQNTTTESCDERGSLLASIRSGKFNLRKVEKKK